jgi:hypothetical protein
LLTIARIEISRAVIVSTRADEPFFRGVEPERSHSHTAGARRAAPNARPGRLAMIGGRYGHF